LFSIADRSNVFARKNSYGRSRILSFYLTIFCFIVSIPRARPDVSYLFPGRVERNIIKFERRNQVAASYVVILPPSPRRSSAACLPSSRGPKSVLSLSNRCAKKSPFTLGGGGEYYSDRYCTKKSLFQRTFIPIIGEHYESAEFLIESIIFIGRELLIIVCSF